jgi:hypothetical protein
LLSFTAFFGLASRRHPTGDLGASSGEAFAP